MTSPHNEQQTPDPSHQGLTQAATKARLESEGYNELPRARRRTPLRIVLDVLREPMLALLIAGGVVYLLLAGLEEALVLLAFACLSVGITVVQEARTERVLEALRDLTSPRALVIRGGERQRIAGREVARGDLIVLAEGDRVPADATLLVATGLSQKEVSKTVTNFDDRKKAEARVALEDIAREMGFSLAQLVGSDVQAMRAPASQKYRHPENTDLTWSGRGRKPLWFVEALKGGKTAEDLAIS